LPQRQRDGAGLRAQLALTRHWGLASRRAKGALDGALLLAGRPRRSSAIVCGPPASHALWGPRKWRALIPSASAAAKRFIPPRRTRSKRSANRAHWSSAALAIGPDQTGEIARYGTPDK